MRCLLNTLHKLPLSLALLVLLGVEERLHMLEQTRRVTLNCDVTGHASTPSHKHEVEGTKIIHPNKMQQIQLEYLLASVLSLPGSCGPSY